MERTVFPIPRVLNISIVIIVSALYFYLFQLGTAATGFWARLGLAFAFGVIMIPIYTLLHEAAHKTLHPNPRINFLLGQLLSLFFGMSYRFYSHCHFKHHRKNRTDVEIWDLYYEHQNKWLRYGNLYLMMMGFGYFSIWLGNVVFAIYPSWVHSKVFYRHKEMGGFIEDLEISAPLRIYQLDSILVIAFQVFCLWLINWDITTWLLFYVMHGFIWSSQNYVNHAFSPRDIINGAHNLTLPKWLNVIYLNFNVHLAHHQNPQIPWVHLPKYITSREGRIPFFKNYLRLWRGPKLTKEASPKVEQTTEIGPVTD
jgi:fatty acid desaturase